MKVTFNNRDPVYLQVVRYFKQEIATGRLQAGQEIPSRRELAGALHINPNTAQKAYKEMEEQGLIRTEGNSPSRITTDERVLSSLREELILDAVHTFVSSIKTIDVPVDELLHIVKEVYAKERSKE
ncbi:GntR family transcriptional regulator [Gordoniibacillus kamchatkensis]|uniref:GntR family transcriptional regulator n=1 Tax=Gordoniibacillus kamchatkensis TaxID=1590651 RepID=A0ABR5AJD2_9BACL|nr:GntR family transcriptional regulator [Paenibacillus sp. VKM B-2647]KIL40863.1 GntR family transcriptional regulator [Paenibacillus sp. VKM B-2647]